MHPPTLSRPSPPRRSSTRRRLSVASRTAAALVGGYALILACVVALSRALALPPGEAVNTAALPAFLLTPAAAVWAFCASTATRAWLGIGLPAAAFALIAWLLRASAA